MQHREKADTQLLASRLFAFPVHKNAWYRWGKYLRYKTRAGKTKEEPNQAQSRTKDPVRGPELRIQKLNTNLGIHIPSCIVVRCSPA